MNAKDEFIKIFTENVDRPGSKELLAWLMNTDFFTAPASTKYHCACENGLVMHSVNVFNTMMEKHFDEETDNIESFAICALLHDVCKANFYKVSQRNVKNEQTGQWEKQPFYAVEDMFPYGHGEKSVYIISGFMRLTREEAFAIRYHMGYSSEYDDKRNVSTSFEMFPLAFALSVADSEATYYVESEKK